MNVTIDSGAHIKLSQSVKNTELSVSPMCNLDTDALIKLTEATNA